MPQTVADFMVDALKQAGIKRVYGVVGDSLNGFTDSLRRKGGVDWIHRRHAAAGAFAAGAEAAPDRQSRRLRRKLRTWQPAPDQRPVRLPPLARPRPGDRRTHSQ